MKLLSTTSPRDLIEEVLIPSVKIFVKNQIIETSSPSYSSEKIEFECCLLSSIMTLLLSRKSNMDWFNENKAMYEFTDASVDFYKNLELSKVDNLNLENEENRKGLTDYIFERWGKYESILSYFDPSSDLSELYNEFYSISDESVWWIVDEELNRSRFRLSVLEVMTLILDFGEE